MQTSYILTKTYIPGDTLDSLTNTHIFIPADIKYKHIWRPYTLERTGASLNGQKLGSLSSTDFVQSTAPRLR